MTGAAQGAIEARGMSMFPFVLPGSRLRMCQPRALRVGDIVSFVGARGQLVAHRVRGVQRVGEAVVYVVRGDSQLQCERVPAEAIAQRVVRVEHPLLSYDTDGPRGRILCALALRTPAWTGPVFLSLRDSLLRARRRIRPQKAP